MTRGTTKRLFDILVALIALVILTPVFVAIAVAIKLESPGPVFFLDERVGRYGRRFRMFKFRSMVHRATEMGLGQKLLVNDPRITRVGRFLRRLSLDEMPQLINVLKGDMSIVGPRPCLPVHADHLAEQQQRRFLVKPGMAGLAFIHGRNNLSWAERIEYDLEYVEKYCLKMDLTIFIKAAGIVLRGQGLYSEYQKRDIM